MQRRPARFVDIGRLLDQGLDEFDLAFEAGHHQGCLVLAVAQVKISFRPIEKRLYNPEGFVADGQEKRWLA